MRRRQAAHGGLAEVTEGEFNRSLAHMRRTWERASKAEEQTKGNDELRTRLAAAEARARDAEAARSRLQGDEKRRAEAAQRERGELQAKLVAAEARLEKANSELPQLRAKVES